MKNPISLVATLALVLAALAAGIWFAGGFTPPAGPLQDRMQAATLLPAPKPLAPFALLGKDGQPFGPEDLRGRWTFVFFGYTWCPDICPTTMATLQAMDRQIQEQDPASLADVLLVSVDPERDDAGRLAEYLAFFNPEFLGATGSHEELRALTAQLGVLYARAGDEDRAENYLVDHSASVLLLDPQVRLTAIFGPPHDSQRMAADFAAIQEYQSKN